MQGKYENNPVYELSNHMISTFKHYTKFKSDMPKKCGYDKLDDILKLILLNNGCKISENIPYQYYYNIIPDEYRVYFVTGMIGNDANEYYDFLIFNGMKVLVIFVDYFNFIKDGDIDENDPLYSLKTTMGNSMYYDAIKKIIEIFYLTSEPIPGALLTTAMATTQRWNKSIIAIKILNEIKPVDENDVSDIPMEDIKNILNANSNLQLYGIRTM